jgi:murein DD-endopeptidase MepM/ murein hydrolase activator NlpD
MAVRPWFVAGALCAAMVSSESSRAETPPAEVSWEAASWGAIAAYGREVTARAGAWMTQVPQLSTAAGARLQIYVRNLALESQLMIAQLIPFAPVSPDLTPLVASPVPGVESSGFGWRRDPVNRRAKFHKGTDFRADRGTPVYAAGPGLVAFTGRQRGYGKVIYIDHGGGLVTRYAHLNRIETQVGAPILGGSRIGQVGSTGRTTGPHLHFEVRIEGRAVDPTLAMHVAELQRTDPMAARYALLELDPDAQSQKVDRHDPVRPRTADASKRPERRGAPKRDRALW